MGEIKSNNQRDPYVEQAAFSKYVEDLLEELEANNSTPNETANTDYTEELDALFDNYLKTDPDIQRAMTEFVEQRKQDINEYYKRKGLPEPYLLEGEIMSWNVSGDVTKENAVEQIGNLEPSYEIGEGAKYQLVKARELAIEVIASGAVKGEQFGVNMGGHSKADAPDSALDSFNVSVYAKA